MRGGSWPPVRSDAQEDGDENVQITWPEATGYEAVGGRGLKCSVGGIAVRVGNRAFMHDEGARWRKHPDNDDGQQADRMMISWEKQGKTAVLVALNATIVGCFAMSDRIKSDAVCAVEYLREKLHVETWMVTGGSIYAIF